MLNHIISSKDFDKETLLNFVKYTSKFYWKDHPIFTERKILATLFFEPSTRTRLSFETAMLRLGGQVITVADSSSSSTQKGESIYDTIRTVEGYADAIVIRHPLEGTARLASCATKMSIPIINGGDGAVSHPSQCLTDAFSIYEKKRKLSNLKIGYMGDLKYGRTVRSLYQALEPFGNQHFFMPPDPALQFEIPFPQETIYLNSSLPEVIGELDVLYITRLQKERFPDPMEYDRIMKNYQINAKTLQKARPDLILMHPLPRNDEIHPEVDDLPQAYYFQQAHNGVTVRMALLYKLIEEGGL